MRIGSLFSGIGGLELGLERAGLGKTVFQVEIDPFCRKILKKHWPGVPQYEDIRDTGAHNLPQADILCGGFPCQDVSSAGKKRGLSGAKSGLWSEYRRIIEELSPRMVIVENVNSGKKLWLPQVKEDLAALGYGNCAISLSAKDVGAPHLRRRVFVIATNSNSIDLWREHQSGKTAPSLSLSLGKEGTISNSNGKGKPTIPRDGKEVAWVPETEGAASCWPVAPPIRGVDNGIPNRLYRLKALGNAVVPQCAEVIGRIALDILRIDS